MPRLEVDHRENAGGIEVERGKEVALDFNTRSTVSPRKRR
jgi:hypothetical protein